VTSTSLPHGDDHAAPIPLGTISIDSARTPAELGPDSDEVDSVLVSGAKAVHQVLSLEERS
jgi:hypothetical protein